MDTSIPTYHLNFYFYHSLYGRTINLVMDTKKKTALLEYLDLLRNACKAKLLQAKTNW